MFPQVRLGVSILFALWRRCFVCPLSPQLEDSSIDCENLYSCCPEVVLKVINSCTGQFFCLIAFVSC